MYDQGFGVPKDYKEAVKWYRKSAEQGLADAQCNLGYMYDQGFGVPKNYKEVFKWYTKAAEQGDADAQHNLGLMYYNGEGVPKDYKLAVKVSLRQSSRVLLMLNQWLGFAMQMVLA